MGIFTTPTQIISTGIFVRSLTQLFKSRYPKTKIPGWFIIVLTFIFNFIATLIVDIYLAVQSGNWPSYLLIKSIAATIISVLYHDLNTGFKPLQIVNLAPTKPATPPVDNPTDGQAQG